MNMNTSEGTAKSNKKWFMILQMADCQRPKSSLLNSCIFLDAKKHKVAKRTLVHFEDRVTVPKYYIFIQAISFAKH